MGRDIRKPVVWVAVLTVLALVTATCHADPRKVITVAKDGTGEFSTIQQAIDATPEHAVIRVGAGTWEESLRLDKPLTLEGDGWQRTRLIGGSQTEASEEVVRTLQKILAELESDATREEVLAAFQRVHRFRAVRGGEQGRGMMTPV